MSMGGLIALFNVFWAYNICEALILESPDENRYSIGGIYARPWTSINTIDEIVDSIDAQINKKFINANRYIAANNMPEDDRPLVKRYNRIGGMIVMGRRK
uniref:Abhydrolase_3 domain-containing protein n=1 Tax=Ascaris lumbricoides TaxID=6252 RepID=A0A0M3I2U4_ASCLU